MMSEKAIRAIIAAVRGSMKARDGGPGSGPQKGGGKSSSDPNASFSVSNPAGEGKVKTGLISKGDPKAVAETNKVKQQDHDNRQREHIKNNPDKTINHSDPVIRNAWAGEHKRLGGK